MKAKYVLRGINYPLVPVQEWTLGEARWVANVLGVRTGELDEDQIDQVVGSILVSVIHANPEWSRSQAQELVDSLTVAELTSAVDELKKWHAEERAEATSPPDNPAATPEKLSNDSSSESTTSPEDSLGVPV